MKIETINQIEFIRYKLKWDIKVLENELGISFATPATVPMLQAYERLGILIERAKEVVE